MVQNMYSINLSSEVSQVMCYCNQKDRRCLINGVCMCEVNACEVTRLIIQTLIQKPEK